MNRSLRFGQPAADELEGAIRWYESRRVGLGAEFFDAIATTIATIDANPEVGATRSTDGKTRRLLLNRFPYEVVYRIRPDELVVVAIAHLKRKPGYWKNRADH